RLEADDLGLAPLFAGPIDQFGSAVKQPRRGSLISVIPHDLRNRTHEEWQEDPVLAGTELLDRVFHLVEEFSLAIAVQSRPATEDHPFARSDECFMLGVQGEQTIG